MIKKSLTVILVALTFFLGLTFVYAEEENILEGEDKSEEVVESNDTTSNEPVIVNDNSSSVVTDNNTEDESNESEPVINNDENVSNENDSNINNDNDSNDDTIINNDNVIDNNENSNQEQEDEIIDNSTNDNNSNVEQNNNSENANTNNDYNVIFNYNNYRYTMSGGDSIKLSKLILDLNMGINISDIKSISSSDTDLLTVVKDGSDYKVVSLQSFTTDEVLIIEMNDGSIYMINIVDPAGDAPAHTKTLVDNHDGTYTIELTVTGESETVITKANVIIVMDKSNSMILNYTPTSDPRTTYTYDSSTYDTNNRYYTSETGDQRVYYRRSNWRLTDTNNGTVYDGDVWVQTYETRLAAEQQALNNLVDNLLSNNDSSDPNKQDIIEISLITYNITSYDEISNTTSADDLKNIINNSETKQGTNWEDALSAALTEANKLKASESNEDVYVIFLTDGEPTAHHGDTTYSSGLNNYWIHWREASDDAQAIATNYHLYTIFTYGEDEAFVNCLDNLTHFAYGERTYTIETFGNKYDTQENFFDASNTTVLVEAFNKIAHDINTSGIGDASIVDGTPNNIVTSSGTSNLLDVDGSSFKYYKSTDGVNFTPWTNAPAATLSSDKTVTWDLGDELLENGVTYKITFDVWPSQETLDLIADLKNNPDLYDTLPTSITKYLLRSGSGVNATYNLRTNTTALLNFVDTRPGGITGPSAYVNPDPVETKATESMVVTKEWHVDNVSDFEDEDVELYVNRDGKNWYKIDLVRDSEDPKKFTGTAYISVGIITEHDGVVTLKTTGHEYSFSELGNDAYHWEIKADTVRPMLINGVLTQLVLVKEEPTSGKYYTLDGKYYVIGTLLNGEAQLTAINEKRSNLDIVKVSSSNSPEDDEYEFTFKVTSAESSNPDDQYIWFSVVDLNSGSWDPIEVETSATMEVLNGVGTNYYYVNSGLVFENGVLVSKGAGEVFTVIMKNGYSLRIRNVLSGSEFEIYETIPSNYALTISSTTDTNYTQVGNNKVTGKIETTKQNYNITFTNEYQLIDVTVIKVWDDEDDKDKKRPTSLVVTLSNGETVTLNEENNWTGTVKGLPKYKDDQVIDYTWTEEGLPEGYTLTSTETDDTGYITTLTNSYTPERIKVTVIKIWDDKDNYDKVRPNSVTIILYANDEKVGSVELSEENGWTYTWTNLDKNEDGKEIIYTVGEDEVEGYTTEIEGDMYTEFIVTNTHSGKGGDENPKTADSIYTYIAMLLISMFGFIKFAKSYVKNN